MSQRQPLEARRVAVTRPLDAGGRLARLLEALGASVLLAPAIRRLPPESWEALDRGIARLLAGAYRGVLFTSPAAVEPFWQRLTLGGGGRVALEGLLIGAVGRGTASALEARGVQVEVCPEREEGAALAEAVIDHLGAALGGARFLQPRAQEGRLELSEGLAGRGAKVEIAAAYRTRAASPQELAPLVEALRAGEVDALVFASPSAVQAVHAACGGERLGHPALVAIGETTALAIEEIMGRQATVAAATDDGSLARAVVSALG